MVPHTQDELASILSLQKENLQKNISQEEVQSQGFVTVVHDMETLASICRPYRHAMVYDGKVLKGYALVMLREHADKIKILIPMFKKINTLSYQASPLSSQRYFVMGQICIAKPYRSTGLFATLYHILAEQMRDHFDFIITEVSMRNPRSLRAHEKVGFENIHQYNAEGEDWIILLLPINKSRKSIASNT